MMKTAVRALITGTAAGAAIVLGAAAASAATTLTITVTHAASTGAVSAKSGKTILKDVTTNESLTCSSSTGTGVVKNQKTKGTAPVKVGTITKSTFTSCVGPLGLKFTVKQNTTWNLEIVSATTKGVTEGGVTNVSATLSGSGCTATVTGSAQGTYTNPSSGKDPILAFNPADKNPNKFKLTVAKGASCLGVVNAGDTVQYTGSYTVTSPTGLTVSSVG